jgi:DEAD/DEAH box helicase/Helicase conserved C-terminal domain
MPISDLEMQAFRLNLGSREWIHKNGFVALRTISSLVGDDDDLSREQGQELLLRSMEVQRFFGSGAVALQGLVRRVGLFPYLDKGSLSNADRLAYEFHRPPGLPETVVFHRPQAEVFRAIDAGENVVLSAPTSFGKSLIIDAIVGGCKYKSILLVVPTIALIDETRRRLRARFSRHFKVITHSSQDLAERNIFVLTQERVLERDILDLVELVIIDEFYKLSMGRDDDDRCVRLNEVFYAALKKGKQFYLLGPNVRGVSETLKRFRKYREYVTSYRTVVSEVHDVEPGRDPHQALVNTCSLLKEPTLIFCSSPPSAKEVVERLVAGDIGHNAESTPATEWIGRHFHPDWHFVLALERGIGVHHGRIPRALAQYVVGEFNAGRIQFLVCTSTLIEGVNTKAKNVIIFDDKINRSRIDYFTFNNIKGRSGRMGQHFVGHVYLFHAAPTDELPFVDPPSLSQGDDAPESLLLQLDEDDLTAKSRKRIEAYLRQEFLSYDVLKANHGVEPQDQIATAREIIGNLPSYAPLLQWTGIPNYKQIYGVCRLIWNFLGGNRVRAGRLNKPNALGANIIQLMGAPSTRELIDRALPHYDSPDASVQNVLDFLRLWANFHFPRLLRALGSIQLDIFSRRNMRAGNYDLFAAKVEHFFLDPAVVLLEEYGIPIELGRRLQKVLATADGLDVALARLKGLDLALLRLSPFERDLLEDTKRCL